MDELEANKLNRSELRKLERDINPYIETIIEIGGPSTQAIFDRIWEVESKSIEAEEEYEWMARFLQKMIVDDVIQKQAAYKIAKPISIQDQKIVCIMAEALFESLKMRSLVEEGYDCKYMLAYVLNTFVMRAVEEGDLNVAEMIWGMLEQLSAKFGSARRLAPVFSLVRREIAESKDTSFAAFVLIANLSDQRMDKLILNNFASDDDENTWWQA
jgi:hypothetical protein